MKKFSLSEIRNIWLKFFEEKKHLIVESQSLIPKNDNSLLWINSGVATLKKYFSGIENPPSKRLTNSQKCIRTNDIYNVGVTSRHHTFFEMLGNFSVGDYFRKDAIAFAYELLTEKFKIDKDLLYITVYKEDNESYELWQKHGIKKEHIIKCDKDRNFWEIGQGPCGPCTEIYYDRGPKYDPDNIGEKLFLEDIENDRYIEIWNIVFSEFENDGNNNYSPLIRKNIDTGAGLERLACVFQDVPTNYDIDTFAIVKNEIQKHTQNKYDIDLYFKKQKDPISLLVNRSFNVIIDHFKSATFAIGDGALPSNKDRGYIIRKLLRRSFVYLDILKVKKDVNEIIVSKIIDTMKDFYPDLVKQKNNIISVIKQEYKSHHETLKNTISEFVETINKPIKNSENKNYYEHTLFKLVETYGFPIEIIKEIEHSKNESKETINFIIEAFVGKEINVDNVFSLKKFDFDKFNQFFEEHKEVSKGNKELKAIAKQNKNLMSLEVESTFDYDNLKLKGSKVVALFDSDFNEVKEVNNSEGYVVLDKTCLYATSGGQLCDNGTIGQVFIDDVVKAPNGQHVHHFEKGSLKVGSRVDVTTDTQRRKALTIHHSTEHLLHSALKNEIHESIKQEGALKTPQKVTFDFSYNKKLDLDEILKLEKNIKDVIKSSVASKTYLKTLDEAQQMGALAYFDDVYKKIKTKLRVVQLGDKSIEICGGTHVSNTKDIEDFKIIKLDSKGSGSWRIEAISSKSLIEDFNKNVHKPLLATLENLFNEYKSLNFKYDLFEKNKSINLKDLHYFELKNLFDILSNELNIIKFKVNKEKENSEMLELKNKFDSYNDKINLIVFENIDRKVLSSTCTNIVNEKKENIFIVLNYVDNSIQYILCTNPKFSETHNFNLNLLNKEIVELFKGKGGGRNNFVQGSFSEINKKELDKILEKAKNLYKW